MQAAREIIVEPEELASEAIEVGTVRAGSFRILRDQALRHRFRDARQAQRIQPHVRIDPAFVANIGHLEHVDGISLDLLDRILDRRLEAATHEEDEVGLGERPNLARAQLDIVRLRPAGHEIGGIDPVAGDPVHHERDRIDGRDHPGLARGLSGSGAREGHRRQ
jgi:hypothetical protein